MTGWSSGPGTKSMTFSYTEGGKTVTRNITITVLPNLTGLSVSPDSVITDRYTALPITVKAHYENGSSKIIYTYTVEGYNASVIGGQTVRISYTEGNITKSIQINVTVTRLHHTCPRCGAVYFLDENDIDNGCPVCTGTIIRIEVEPTYVRVEQGKALTLIVSAIYKDGHKEIANDWTSNFNNGKVGLQTVTVEYGGVAAQISVWVYEKNVICPICGTPYPVSEGACPICSENVVRIEVYPKELTVSYFDPINLTVTAYYADGSSGTVTDWSIDRTSTEAGTFTANVSYHNVSATITLTVIPISAVECPFCELIYDPTVYPSGCPVCSETIIGIEAYLSGGGNLVQYGSSPGFMVVLIFKDEHRELELEDYTVENCNPYQLGPQNILVRYHEFFREVSIHVVDTVASITCPNGHVYYQNEEDSDSDCPYCAMTSHTGTVYFFDITYINEIISDMYAYGAYVFEQGNYITVTVTKKNKSLLFKMQNTFFRTSMLGSKKKFVLGGGVY